MLTCCSEVDLTFVCRGSAGRATNDFSTIQKTPLLKNRLAMMPPPPPTDPFTLEPPFPHLSPSLKPAPNQHSETATNAGFALATRGERGALLLARRRSKSCL